jgi:hypothetical protein
LIGSGGSKISNSSLSAAAATKLSGFGGGGSKISIFSLSAAAATKLSGFGGGGSKISIFFCLSAAVATKLSGFGGKYALRRKSYRRNANRRNSMIQISAN